jgi:hypothetical protein
MCQCSQNFTAFAVKSSILLLSQPKDFIEIVYSVHVIHILPSCLAEHCNNNSSFLPYVCFSVMDGTLCHKPATLLLTTDDNVDGYLYKTNKIISYSVKNCRRKEIRKANKLPDIPVSSVAQASEYVYHLSLWSLARVHCVVLKKELCPCLRNYSR